MNNKYNKIIIKRSKSCGWIIGKNIKKCIFNRKSKHNFNNIAKTQQIINEQIYYYSDSEIWKKKYNNNKKIKKKNYYNNKNQYKNNISYGIILLSIEQKYNDIFNIIYTNESSYEVNQYLEHIYTYWNNINTNININLKFQNIKNDNKYIKIYNFLKRQIKFLIICRKYSVEFSEFINGKYNKNKKYTYDYFFNYMTKNEIEKIKHEKFINLWNFHWWNNIISKENYNKLKEKFTFVKNNIIFENLKCKYDNLEWGFPKGKKIIGESNINCALREFEEETTLLKSDITIFKNIPSWKEIYLGTNNKKYINEYHYAFIQNWLNFDFDKIKDSFEVWDIKWINYKDIDSYIRDYHIKKKNVFTNTLTSLTIILYFTKQFDIDKIIIS